MKEHNPFPGQRIGGRNRIGFEFIARPAGQTQVIEFGFPALRYGLDVIERER